MATVKFWQGMQKASTVNGDDKMMLGKDSNGEAMYIDFNDAKDYLNITGIEIKAVEGGATEATAVVLSPGPEGQQRKMEKVTGWFKNATGSAWLAPLGYDNTNWWSGTVWSLGSSVEMPSVPVSDSFGSSTTDAISQAKATELKDRLDDVEETVPNLLEKGGYEGTAEDLDNRINEVEGDIPDVSGLASKDSVAMKADVVIGKNKFNKDDTSHIAGFFLNSNGNQQSSGSYFISEFIPILGSTAYTYFGWSVGAAFNIFYDENKNVISNFNSSPSTSPANARFVRLSGLVANKGTMQFQVSDGTAVYEPFKKTVPQSQIEVPLEQTISETNTSKAVSGRAVSLSLNSKLDVSVGKNRFNPNDPGILVDRFINSSGAIVTASPTFTLNVTGLIPAVEGQAMKGNFGVANTYAAWYDANGVYVSGSAVNSNLLPWVAGAKFARFTYNRTATNIQIEVGSTSTAYIPYTETAFIDPLVFLNYERPVEVVLPSRLYFVTNLQTGIYYENILRKDIGDPARVLCPIGISFNNVIRFNFNTVVTNGVANIVTTYKLKRSQTKTVNYTIKSPTVNNGKVFNVLFIGNSFTDIGDYIKRCKNLLESNGATVNLLGTTGNSTFKAESQSGGTLANVMLNSSLGVARVVQVTGMSVLPQTNFPGTRYTDANGLQWSVRGGKIDSSGNGHVVVTSYEATESRFENFPSSGILTKIVADASKEGDQIINYTNPVAGYYNQMLNPSTGQLDLPNYISRWDFETPNLIVIQFTTNDVQPFTSDASINSFLSNIKTAIDHIHASFPDCKVIFSIEPIGSMSVNINAAQTNNSIARQDLNGRKLTFLKVAESLFSTYENDPAYNNFVYIAPSYAVVDLVNGYHTTTNLVPMSRYPEVTERSGGDGVHPNINGMEQIGECIYQLITNIF